GVGSVLTLNGGAIDIDAESKSRHYVLASSKGLSKGSGSTGVGASIALEIAMDTTDAGILDATTMNGTANGGGGDVVSTFLSGDGDGCRDDAIAEAIAASAGTANAVGVAVAVSYIDDLPRARIGTGGGNFTMTGGNLSVTADHTGVSYSKADG